MQFIYKVTYFIPITIALPMQCCINWATIIKYHYTSMLFTTFHHFHLLHLYKQKEKKEKFLSVFKHLPNSFRKKSSFSSWMEILGIGVHPVVMLRSKIPSVESSERSKERSTLHLGFLKHLHTSQNINHNTEDNIYTQSEWGANRAKQQQAVFYPSESAVSSGSSCDTRIQTCQHGHEHNTWRAQHSQSREVRYKCTESKMCSCSFSTCTHTPHTTGARRMANMCQRLDQSMYLSCVMAVWNDTYRNTKGWPLDLMTSWQVLSVLLLRVFVPVILI